MKMHKSYDKIYKRICKAYRQFDFERTFYEDRLMISIPLELTERGIKLYFTCIIGEIDYGVFKCISQFRVGGTIKRDIRSLVLVNEYNANVYDTLKVYLDCDEKDGTCQLILENNLYCSSIDQIIESLDAIMAEADLSSKRSAHLAPLYAMLSPKTAKPE